MRAQGRSGLVETLLLVGDTTPQSASPTAPLAQGSRDVLRIAFVLSYAYCSGAGAVYLSLSHGVLIFFHRDSSLLRGSRGRSRAVHRFIIDRGAEKHTPSPLCALPIKMCRHGRHT